MTTTTTATEHKPTFKQKLSNGFDKFFKKGKDKGEVHHKGHVASDKDTFEAPSTPHHDKSAAPAGTHPALAEPLTRS